MSYEKEEADNRAKDIVYDHRDELVAARIRFRDEEGTNGVSESAYKELCNRIVETDDFLTQFEDESAVDDELFEEFKEAVGVIKSKRGREVEVDVAAPGDTSATETAREPAILTLNAEWLIGVSIRAERIIKEIGYGPNAKMKEAELDEAVV